MLNRERERQILREYEAVLDEAQSVAVDAEAAFVLAQREVDEVRAIVDRLRVRVGDDPTPESQGTQPAATPRKRPRRHRGRVSLPQFLETLMADGKRRTVDEIEAAIHAAPEFADSPPNRNTLNTRLGELARRGTLTKHPDRSYQNLVPAGGDAENPDERGGPNPAAQLDVEKPPADQLIPDRPGHPINSEGAAGDRSRLGL